MVLNQQSSELNQQEANGTFETLADSSPLLIWTTDTQGGSVYLNQAYRDLIGVTLEEVRGLEWQSYFHPDDVSAYQETFQQAVREQKEFRREARVRGVDGTWHWIISYAKSRFSSQGIYQGLLGSSTDITDRKLAEEELLKNASAWRKSEEKFSKVFQSNPTGLSITRLQDGKFLDVNESYLHLVGYIREELIGKTTLDLGIVTPDERERTIQYQKEHGNLLNFEFQIRRKTGESREVLTSVELIEIDGETCALTNFIDITERKLAESFGRALNEIQQIVHSSLDFQEIIGRSLSAAGKALDCDTAVLSRREGERWLVSSVWNFPEELIGMEMDDTQELHAILAIQTKMPVAVSDAFNDERFNRQHLRKWGVRSVLVMPVIIKDEAKGVIFFNYQRSVYQFTEPYIDFVKQLAASLSLALENSRLFQNLQEEIIERKRIEKALEISERRSRELIQYAPSAIYEIDLQTLRFTSVNDAMVFMSGYSREELLQMGAFDLLDEESQAILTDRIYQLQSGKEPEKSIEYGIKTRDGHTIYVIINTTFNMYENGKPVNATIVAHDITERKQMEQVRLQDQLQIELQRRLMEQREQDRYAIARDLHDGPIQTLSSIMFQLQMLKEAFPDPSLQAELSHFGEDIKRTIQELRDVLNELRPPALIQFGFSKVARMYIEDLKARFPNIEFEANIAENDQFVSKDVHLTLFRLLQEGINNIIRHSDASKVWVVYRIEQDGFRLELRDNGKGFEVKRNLSQLAQHGHYGLVGMKERAEAFHGEFKVISEIGKGTTVIITGPLSEKNIIAS